MSMSNIPDSILPYLEEIAGRLWSGHAAVMVGAGFSKNAKRTCGASKEFPDWNQLGDAFYEKAYGKKPGPTQRYMDPLKLAEEVEASQGRPALDRLISSLIPDQEFSPSDMHVSLLYLPWTDVFTTNYDTLLERALEKVIDRKYSVVVRMDDLTFMEKPRIAKLHGSFPSTLPFVVTEEDYRKYPVESALFVNTVQQSLVENTLCLIGFSGDDPNFLKWIGWVRDNLGAESPKMYLVGVLSLSESQRKLLERRNVIPVDMGLCVDAPKNHAEGIKAFLDFLSGKGKERRLEDWPRSRSPMFPDRTEIRTIVEAWKRDRLEYPGWHVVPKAKRETLWGRTRNWMEFLDRASGADRVQFAAFAYELFWRQEKCLFPVLNSQVESLKKAIGIFEEIMNGIDVEAPIEKSFAGTAFFDLGLMLARYFREEGNTEDHAKVLEWLEKHPELLGTENEARLMYEKCMGLLFRLEFGALKQFLKQWRPDDSLPFWKIRKASLLMEIGELEEAGTLIEEGLFEIRKNLIRQADSYDQRLRSQESLALILFHALNSVEEFRKRLTKEDCSTQKSEEPIVFQKIRENILELFRELKSYYCDPFFELDMFKLSLGGDICAGNRVSIKHGFDLGIITTTMLKESDDTNALLGYAFLRYCEEAGLPFRISNLTIATDCALGAIWRIWKYWPYWSVVTLLRLCDRKKAKEFFDRRRIAAMPSSDADSLVTMILKAVAEAAPLLGGRRDMLRESLAESVAQMAPEILSLLCSKASLESRMRIFDFLEDLYRDPKRYSYSGVGDLMRRLMESLTERAIIPLIPRMATFPVQKTEHPIYGEEFPHPLLPAYGYAKSIKGMPKPDVGRNVVENAFVLAESTDSVENRKWGIFTLAFLYDSGFLDDACARRFGDALWKERNEDGLPGHTMFRISAFVTLPHPDDVDPEALMRAYIRRTPFPIQARSGEKGFGITFGNIPICDEILAANGCMELGGDLVREVLVRIFEWWDADKERMKVVEEPSLFGTIAEEFRSRFGKLKDILVNVIIPYWDESFTDRDEENLERLVQEFGEYGLPKLEALARSLLVRNEAGIFTPRMTEKALASNDHAVVVDALKAICWIVTGKSPANPDVKSVYIRQAVQVILLQKSPGLISAINAMISIIRSESGLVSEDVVSTMLSALEELADHFMDRSNGMEFEEKLSVRVSAARLAHELYRRRFADDAAKGIRAIPPEILRWKEICASPEEFAEVRNSWTSDE